MKKLILIAILALVTVFSSQAGHQTGNTNGLAAAGIAKVVTGASLLDYVLLTSSSTNTATIKLYNTQYTGLWVTNGAYTTITTYATNKVSTWVNYYGVSNSTTNLVLAHITNTIAAGSNALSAVFVLSTPTNTTTSFQGLNTVFGEGIVIENAGSDAATVSFGYYTP